MHTGSELLETWIPDGGFRIERRKLKPADGGSAIAECLVPKWTDDELTADRPCARQPCLHRIVADCLPEPEAILNLASRYGLLTVSIPRPPVPGQVVRAGALPPEPIEIWKREIQALRACAVLWDAGVHEGVARKLSEHLACVPFHLRASEKNPLAFRYCPVTLSAALWQRFAAEVAGLLDPARCPAPKCGRWFLQENGRSDRRFCSHACQMRVWRATPT